MCGIAGQVRADGNPVDRGLIDRMCAAVRHRGPDSHGMFLADGVGLGIQRLAVIDRQTGDQPIFNEDRSVVVVLNGEIYNYRELREDLVSRGHRFATRSDTEVIVHLYEELGERCVARLHGMFAFALWDVRRRQLVLARDRVGKKPLFYALRGHAMTFASELGAVLADRDVSNEPDHRAMDCFFAYQYVPAPMSAFVAIKKLPPASVLVLRDGKARIERYWSLDFARKRTFASTAEAHEAIRDGILKSVRRRLVADVPVGAFLSGGVDSSAVVAAMARTGTGTVRTFSIGFEVERFNELPYAKALAERLGTQHHEYVVRPDAMAMLPKMVKHYGEPFADSSAVPSFYLAELARRHVTVALNGDGGDEAFGGYPRYPHVSVLQRLDRVPQFVRRAGAAVCARLPERGDRNAPLRRARRVGETLALSTPERYVAYMSTMGGGLRPERLYTPEYAELVGPSAAADVLLEPWRESTGAALVDIMLDVDTRTYLPGDLLVKMDIATMAFSLEARSPFLDHELLELAASLPATLKVRGAETKVGLRDALRPWLGDEVLDRPKRGFEAPVSEWLRSELQDEVRDILLEAPARARGYFREPYVRELLDRHATGAEDNSKGIWALLMFELWHRTFVDTRVAHTS